MTANCETCLYGEKYRDVCPPGHKQRQKEKEEPCRNETAGDQRISRNGT
jgi:hypothetical protein